MVGSACTAFPAAETRRVWHQQGKCELSMACSDDQTSWRCCLPLHLQQQQQQHCWSTGSYFH